MTETEIRDDAQKCFRAEIADLEAKLQPSPCGVAGHRACDWVTGSGIGKTFNECLADARYCLACQRPP